MREFKTIEIKLYRGDGRVDESYKVVITRETTVNIVLDQLMLRSYLLASNDHILNSEVNLFDIVKDGDELSAFRKHCRCFAGIKEKTKNMTKEVFEPLDKIKNEHNEIRKSHENDSSNK